jgi:phosphatidylglycerol---prolipoprotein diacylglyceryl transferase
VIPYPNISPEIIRIGPIALRWYGLMYVIGFIFGFHILKARIRAGFYKIPLERADAYITYVVVGMLIGARLAYVFIYDWPTYAMDPIRILYIHQGGLSFHGAATGMIVASLLFARRSGVPGYSALDTLAICSPFGLGLGRIGNFINAELYGRATDLPWAMIFPTDPNKIPRHPSQFYQCFAEGPLLFLCLSGIHRYMVRRGRYRDGIIGSSFVALYGFFRFFTEFAREPDAQLGFVLGNFSMGQVLCALMMLISVGMFLHVRKVSPPLKVPNVVIKTPAKMDAIDRSLFWPLERFLARFVA